MNEKKDSRPSSLSSTYQGYLDTLVNSRIVPSRLLSELGHVEDVVEGRPVLLVAEPAVFHVQPLEHRGVEQLAGAVAGLAVGIAAAGRERGRQFQDLLLLAEVGVEVGQAVLGRGEIGTDAGFAEFERGLLIDRITKDFERKAARGEWLGGPGPYGYTLDSATKTLIVDTGEADTAQAIFAKYVEERYGATASATTHRPLTTPPRRLLSLMESATGSSAPTAAQIRWKSGHLVHHTRRRDGKSTGDVRKEWLNWPEYVPSSRARHGE